MTPAKVQVYWNVRRQQFSIRDARTRRVVAHADRVDLAQAEFKVFEAGRRRVLASGVKNVHAWVEGYLVGPWDTHARAFRTVSYNPFKMATFEDVDGKPIHWCDRVVLREHRELRRPHVMALIE